MSFNLGLCSIGTSALHIVRGMPQCFYQMHSQADKKNFNFAKLPQHLLVAFTIWLLRKFPPGSEGKSVRTEAVNRMYSTGARKFEMRELVIEVQHGAQTPLSKYPLIIKPIRKCDLTLGVRLPL